MHRNLASPLLCSILAGISLTAGAQVYDWSMQTAGTGPNLAYNMPYWGPRNYIAAGNFNASDFNGGFWSFASCNETHFATWGPGSTQFTGNNVRPSPLFDLDFHWPYQFRWYCSFDETYFLQHPANFYAGVISLDLHKTTNSGAERYNYMLFELKAPLQQGVAYVFRGSIAAGTITPTSTSAHLDNIGLALLHDLPVPDSSYAFLDGITPWLSTPAGAVVGPNTTTLTDTIIGNGERYLVVGLFDPIGDHAVSHPPALNTAYHYVLDNFFLYRRDCNYSNTQFWEPSVESCRDEPYEVQLMYYPDVSPTRQWYLDGVLQADSTGYEIVVPHAGSPQTFVTAVTDTGFCADTASFTVNWRYVEPLLPDTFTVCGQPVLLAIDTVLHHILPYQWTVNWDELTGNFSLNNQQSLNASLPDSGTYAVTMNYNGCVQRDTMIVGPDIPLMDTTLTGDPALQAEVLPEHCVNMHDGAVIVHDMGYPGTLRYDWYDTPLAGVDTNHVDSLTQGTYHVRIADEQNRCTVFAHTVPQFLDLCAMIRGKVYEDTDLDCVQDSAEAVHALRTITAMPVGNVAITAPDGTYEILVPPGTHTVEATYTDPFVGNVCGDGAQVTVAMPGVVADHVDIADTTHIPVHDMAVAYMHRNQWVIGFDGSLSVHVRNKGETPEQTILKLVFQHPDLDLLPEVVGGTFLGVVGDTLFVETPLLAPSTTHSFGFRCEIPANPDLLSTVAHVQALLTPVPAETEIPDNADEVDIPIVGAYDPNDKLVSPYGDPFTHAVDTTVHRLLYTIRFQNTGNWPATTVRLEDELSPLLVMQSLHVIASSHTMQAYSFGSVLYFEFPSIMLPDSASDPEGSNGWVTFTLNVDDGVVYGDSIINRANIYFDFNPPIVTPPAITRFQQPLTTNVPEGTAPASRQRFVLAPNPAHGSVSILDRSGSAHITRVELIDAQGRQRATNRSGTADLPLEGLPSGIYTVRIHTTEGVHPLPLVKH